MPIQRLPIHLVNKIAAGEVVERPASVVKELVENALDADPTRIDITIEKGGKKLISVTDHGAGMSADDLALSLAQHSTSKISNEDDLHHIVSMGFRGEALASIASISHAHVRTRARDADDESGYEIDASGETISQVRPCASAPGTTVTVRDLFFNTPARRKFLRTDSTEFSHITEQLTRLALPRCDVTFTLTHNGRQVQNLPPTTSTAQRVGDLFGAELVSSLIPIGRRGGEIELAGLIGVPSVSRSSGKLQYFFLNGRYIRDRVLSHALREAYRGLTEPSRYPVGFLFLEIDPEQFDINVHPTKIEVRFRDSHGVHGEVLGSLRETLNKANLTPAMTVDDAMSDGEGPGGRETEQRKASLREAMADFFKSAPPREAPLGFPDRSARGAPAGASGTYESSNWDGATSVSEPGVRTATTEKQEQPTTTVRFRNAVQLHNSYIVTECEDGVLIVDQHAMHERILYNELKKRIEQGKLVAQRMLIPETVDVSPTELEALQSHDRLLEKLGIEIAPFGPHSVAVQQFPAMLSERKVPPAQFVRELLDMLTEQTVTDVEQLLEGVLQLIACKGAVKAGQKLGTEEIEDLLLRAQGTQKSSSCPHGRPTTVKLTIKDLEKQFKRI